MKSIEIRKKFFEFFEKRGHTRVPSSSLIPAQDPTILFTNAGMNQFKDVFLGKENRSYARAVSIQKCTRAGGKHNDLDNVGYTKRHLTFFEMMGNFSFGDYFKKEAIQFAWEFLTKEMEFDTSKMLASVYKDDQESYEIWQHIIGLPTNKIFRLGQEDNFWQVGETGPCGPCTEIYMDQGEQLGCGKQSCSPGCSCDRFLEVWNLVFMQYNRQPDGTDLPLEKTGVDTGMGLERLTVIMQKKQSVFQTDLFEPIIQKIATITNIDYATCSAEIRTACNVMADHTRSSSFLIADGVTPSNEGRGYVLRKIIRRAALFMQKVTKKNILPDLADTLINFMSAIYPNLQESRKNIMHLLTTEVEKFSQNLVLGQKILHEIIQTSSDNIIYGHEAFKLYDTYGFPLELTKVLAQEYNMQVDITGFQQEMAQQRKRSQKKQALDKLNIVLPKHLETTFTGYQELKTTSTIIGIIKDGQLVEKVNPNTDCWIITDKSPFYVEKGGQVSDEGKLLIDQQEIPVFGLQRVDNTIAAYINTPIHLTVDQKITSVVDTQHRLDIMNNHTATHLLQAVLIETLGKNVKQSGSLVHPDYLRFDFTYHASLTQHEIAQVEKRVNEKIRENISLNIYETSYDQAVANGVIAIFGEKYNPEKVRVIDIHGFSKELCGGTHVQATGDIGCFKITQEQALSAGQRRITALTGRKAIKLFQDNFGVIKELSQRYKVPFKDVLSVINKNEHALKDAQATIKNLQKKLMIYHAHELLQETEKYNQFTYGVFEVRDIATHDLQEMIQYLTDKQPGLYCLLTHTGDKSFFVCSIHTTIKHQIPSLKKLAQRIKEKTSLQGGGKDTLIQGGGEKTDAQQLKAIIESWLKEQTT